MKSAVISGLGPNGVLAALELLQHGYQVTVTELVGWEHSMKNELIIARHVGQKRKNATTRLEEILHELNLDELRERFMLAGTNVTND